MHGDVYLHNTLLVPPAAAGAAAVAAAGGGGVLLADFGAASVYDRALQPQLEKIEVRSFGYLLKDLLAFAEQASARTAGPPPCTASRASMLSAARTLLSFNTHATAPVQVPRYRAREGAPGRPGAARGGKEAEIPLRSSRLRPSPPPPRHRASGRWPRWRRAAWRATWRRCQASGRWWRRWRACDCGVSL